MGIARRIARCISVLWLLLSRPVPHTKLPHCEQSLSICYLLFLSSPLLLEESFPETPLCGMRKPKYSLLTIILSSLGRIFVEDAKLKRHFNPAWEKFDFLSAIRYLVVTSIEECRIILYFSHIYYFQATAMENVRIKFRESSGREKVPNPCKKFTCVKCY